MLQILLMKNNLVKFIMTKSIFNEYKDVGCVLLDVLVWRVRHKIREKFPNVRFIDSVKIGIEQLATLIRFDRQV